jgi:outer membrane receptor for ferrienterochelin and colicins
MPRVLLSLFAALVLLLAGPGRVRADDVAEAAQFFDRGNAHFEAGMRLRGARRLRELEAALGDYFESLRRVRSRNVLYNAALVLEQLGRWDDAFNHWSEYLGTAGLTDEEQRDGAAHRDALRPRVAVVRVETEPAGASIWIDRRDLGARGVTPVEIAVPAGEHRLFFEREGWRAAEVSVTATLGATTGAAAALAPAPVLVQVLAPEATLRLDGAPIPVGSSVEVVPGSHRLTLEVEGVGVVERAFEVLAGSAPMVIDLTAAAALVAAPIEATLAMRARRPGRLLIDGELRGVGLTVEIAVPPGEHEIALETDGAPTFGARYAFAAGRRVGLEVDARGTSAGLVAGRALAGVMASIGVLAAAGLSIGAWDAHERYRGAPSQGGFDTVNSLNLAADVAWGAGCALGLAAIVFVIADDAGVTGTVEEAE